MLEDFHAQPARDRVIVALDCDAATALCLAVQLRGHAKWLKVGMTLYYAEGPKIVQTFKQLGFNVFLDLKFHDIPHQVEGGAFRGRHAHHARCRRFCHDGSWAPWCGSRCVRA